VTARRDHTPEGTITMPYEVDTDDGRCLYRGEDLALACEIHDGVPAARLVMLPAPAAPVRPARRTHHLRSPGSRQLQAAQARSGRPARP
jgi:hypothetical protein